MLVRAVAEDVVRAVVTGDAVLVVAALNVVVAIGRVLERRVDQQGVRRAAGRPDTGADRGVGARAGLAYPVLDVGEPATHAAIGSRAFSARPERVAAMGRAVAEGLLAGGVAPVVKHMPGHGRARADSHHELPVVDAARHDLKRDFAPFAALNDLPMAMSAHVLYTALDDGSPATASPIVVKEVMRGEIGFDGLIMSDDVSMKALTGPYEERAAAIIEAGLDIVLHCNGELDQARAVASAAPEMSGASLRRAKAALSRISAPQPFDLDRGRQELAVIMGGLSVA